MVFCFSFGLYFVMFILVLACIVMVFCPGFGLYCDGVCPGFGLYCDGVLS
jgi:hypothetical protein